MNEPNFKELPYYSLKTQLNTYIQSIFSILYNIKSESEKLEIISAIFKELECLRSNYNTDDLKLTSISKAFIHCTILNLLRTTEESLIPHEIKISISTEIKRKGNDATLDEIINMLGLLETTIESNLPIKIEPQLETNYLPIPEPV